MKSINIYLFALILFTVSAQAQTPLSFNYQGLMTDDQNVAITNEQIDIEIAILMGGPMGTEVFREAHTVETSSIGIFSLKIGEGTPIFRNLANISWEMGEYWIQTDADLDLDGNVETMGVSRLVSVPFALHARTVEDKNDDDADPFNEIQQIIRNGNQIELTQGGGFVLDETDDADADPLNELQDLNVNQMGSVVELGISNGQGVTFGVADSDSDPLNEIQTLNIQGDSLMISNGNKIKLPTGNSLWKQRGDSVYIDSNGSAIVESQNGINRTEMSIWGIECSDGIDRSILSPGSFFIPPTPFNDSMSMSVWANGLSMFKDSAGGQNLLMDLSKNRLRFRGGGNGDYGKNHLSFGDSLAPVTTISHMDSYGMEFINGENDMFANSFGLSVNSPLNQSLLSNSGLYLYGGPTIPSVGIDWALEADSLRGFNSSGNRTIKLGNNPLTNSGILELNASHSNRRLFYLGDLFAEGTAIMAMYNDDENRILSVAGPAGATTYYGGNGSENVIISNEGASNSRGNISIHNALGESVVTMGVNTANDGYLSVQEQGMTSGARIDTDSLTLFGLGKRQIWQVRNSSPYVNTAQMFLNGESQHPNIYLGYDLQNNQPSVGELKVYDHNGTSRVSLHGNGTINGESIIVRNSNGNSRLIMENSQAHDYGLIEMLGPNGNLNVSAGAANQIFTNDGRIDVHDSNGTPQAGIFTDNGLGYFYADVKNFQMDHPEDPEKEIWYAAIEGPEAAAYVRGVARLKNGEAFVPFPDHFLHVGNPATMTVILTPQEWDTFGLAVVEKTAKGIRVKELKGGQGNFEFDWEVKCVRNGFEDFEVVRERK